MFMTTASMNLLIAAGYKQSRFSSLIHYGKDKQGREWQVHDDNGMLKFREVVKYRLGVPIQFSEEFFKKFH